MRGSRSILSARAQFCARGSDFKGLASFFCNSNCRQRRLASACSSLAKSNIDMISLYYILISRVIAAVAQVRQEACMALAASPVACPHREAAIGSGGMRFFIWNKFRQPPVYRPSTLAPAQAGGGSFGPWNFALASRCSDPHHHPDRASLPLEGLSPAGSPPNSTATAGQAGFVASRQRGD